MKKLTIILFGMLLSGMPVFAQQDVHFSQFFSSPLTLNPASAGIFDGDMRAIMNYRNQWSSISEPYVTMAASVDFPVLRKINNGMFGMGINFFKDAAGVSKLGTTNVGLSLAYHLDISGGQKNNYLSVGFQGGMVQRSMSLGNLTWDEQWNGVTFDQQIATVDQLGATSASVFDMGTGLHWYYMPKQNMNIFSGISLFHITSPDIGFNGESPLLKKFTWHGGAEIPAGDDISILPNAVFVKQGPNRYMDLGAEVKVFLQERTKFTNFRNPMYVTIGPYLRLGDALYLVSRFNWNGLAVAISYDFNMSGLTTATGGNGAYELMLGYTANLNANPTRGHSVRFH
ncbi:MAG: PorP/SprF family type IX secretion system membrane protein [Flavobacteriales bacterium]|nr:PorP/SprF family type IX secretion system membrane protein [Flavobacteriales bacterium]